jgi:hypothetical protein
MVKKNRYFTANIKGQLQSGDPATTWSNTFKIILYLNFYFRKIPGPRNELGLLDYMSPVELLVSGDD